MRSMSRWASVPAAALLSCSLLVGCSGLPGTAPPASEPPASPLTQAPPTSVAPSSGPGSADPTQAGSPTAPPAGSRETTIDAQRVALTVFPVRRSGTLSVLDFTLSLPAADPGESPKPLLLSTQFDDRNATTGDRGPYSVDAVKLIDSKNRKAYLVASDVDGRCLCSNDLSTINPKPGETHSFYATFAAPPADVTELEVNVPRFGAIPRVPVQ